MAGVDVGLFRALNGWPDWLDPGLTYFSVAHDTLSFRIAIFTILVLMIARGGASRRTAILALVAFPIADALCNSLKHAFPMRRPFQDLAEVTMRVGYSDSMGTASSHAANLAAVATVMTLGIGLRWGAPWIAIAIAVGLSRVYVGAHYPSQVLLGWSVGIAMGAATDGIVRVISNRFVRQPKAEPTGP